MSPSASAVVAAADREVLEVGSSAGVNELASTNMSAPCSADSTSNIPGAPGDFGGAGPNPANSMKFSGSSSLTRGIIIDASEYLLLLVPGSTGTGSSCPLRPNSWRSARTESGSKPTELSV